MNTIKSTKNIICESFFQRMLQVAFVKKYVANFIQEGIPEQEIIVLADEVFVHTLAHFGIRVEISSIRELDRTFKGVIAIDFNEEYVKHEDKELYLSLFASSDSLAISYVESVTALKSFLLTQLKFQTQRANEEEYQKTLFASHKSMDNAPQENQIEAEYDFTQSKLTPLKLNMFLSCRRKFYYLFVLGLKDKPKEVEMGLAISDMYEALSRIYAKKSRFKYFDELEEVFKESINRNHHLSSTNFKSFLTNEIEYFKNARVVSCDATLEGRVDGIDLMVDVNRVDETLSGNNFLKYKFTYPSSRNRVISDYTLSFIELLAYENGFKMKNNAYFYSLKDGVLHPPQENEMDELSKTLRELGSTKKFDFYKTDTLMHCNYCDYTTICERR